MPNEDPFAVHWPDLPWGRYGLVAREFFAPTMARKQHRCRFSRNPDVRAADCTGWIEPAQVYVAMRITQRERVPYCVPCALANFPRLVRQAEATQGPGPVQHP
jgi:hypothetical protein